MSMDCNNSKTNAWLWFALVFVLTHSARTFAGPNVHQVPTFHFVHFLPQIDETDDDEDDDAETERIAVAAEDGVPEKTQPIEDTPRELSVEPLSPLLPKDRPSWIDLGPQYDSDVHRFVVASLSTPDQKELPSHLDAPLEAEVREYVNRQLGDHAGDQLADRLTAAFIRINYVDENKSYVAELQTSDGPHYQQWVMVEVTPEQRERLRHWHNQELQRQRIWPMGLGIAGLLSLIGLANWGFKRRSNRIAGKNNGAPPVVNLNRAEIAGGEQNTSCGVAKKSWGRRFRSFRRAAVFAGVLLAVVFVLKFKKERDHSDRHHRPDRSVRVESSDRAVDISIETRGRSKKSRQRNAEQRRSASEGRDAKMIWIRSN